MKLRMNLVRFDPMIKIRRQEEQKAKKKEVKAKLEEKKRIRKEQEKFREQIKETARA